MTRSDKIEYMIDAMASANAAAGRVRWAGIEALEARLDGMSDADVAAVFAAADIDSSDFALRVRD